MIDGKFVKDLRCSACAGKGEGELEAKGGVLFCIDCGQTFRVEAGIPVMLLEDYVPLEAG